LRRSPDWITGMNTPSAISPGWELRHWFQALDTMSISPRWSAITYSADPG